MNKNINIKENIRCALLAFFVSSSLCVNNDMYVPTEDALARLNGRWDTFFWKANSSFQHTSYLICLVGILLFFAFKYLTPNLKKENLKWYIPLSSVFSLMLLLCSSYHKHYSWDGVFGSVSAILFALFKGVGLSILFIFLLNFLEGCYLSINAGDASKGIKNNKRTIILKYTILFFILWIPYMVILFPGCTNADTRDQVAQILGNYQYSWTAKTIILQNENVILNNHHPVFFTIILGIFVRLGEMIGSYNWAFEIYCILQSILLACTLACQVYYLKMMCKNKGLHLFAILFFGLSPMFPIWGMTVMKDIFFSILLWWIVVLLYEILKNRMTIKQMIALGFIIFVWFLVRNNGLYICLVMIPFLIMYLWKDRRKLIRVISMLLVVMFIFQAGVQHYLFSALQISAGSPREMLSVPFMQTARYIKEYKDEINADDEEMLLTLFSTQNNSLDDIVEKYDATPDRSDNVKERYNKETDTEVLKEYFKFWLKGLFNHPLCYIQAFLCLNYSWFSFENHHDSYYYNGIADSKISDILPGFENPQGFKPARNILYSTVNILAKIPFTSWIVEFSFYTWAYLICFIFMVIRKKKTEILAMSPVFINYLICFIGPVAYMRYAVPALVCFPTLIMFAFGREEKENEKNSSVNSLL